MKRIGEKISLSDPKEVPVCQKAIIAGGGPLAMVASVHGLDTPFIFGKEPAHYIKKGLADIALGSFGENYYGLTQGQADQVIKELYGEPEEQLGWTSIKN